MSEKFLLGKVAIVTGASRGIGRAIALKLANLGCHVAFNYHSAKEAAESLVAEIRKQFQHEYQKSAALYYQGQPPFDEILDLILKNLSNF